MSFWGLMTAGCVLVLIYHLTTSCILYFSHETDVNVALVTRRQLTFPAVTICNLNPVRQSAVSESSALSRLINDDKRTRKKRAKKNPRPLVEITARSTDIKYIFIHINIILNINKMYNINEDSI